MNLSSIFSLSALSALAYAGDMPDGNAVIRGKDGASEIVITTSARCAGAIQSLTWNGTEFLDAFDHGRELQSASNFDCAGPMHGETYNPTEAGSMRDGAGPASSSKLLHLRVEPDALQSSIRMAFWLAPGEKSSGFPAKNTKILSDHLLTKRVRIGWHDMTNVIPYDVTFSVPIGEHHNQAVFEALTGYMPPAFGKFLQFNPQTGELEPLSDGPGEGPRPVVLSTPDGSHAMGIYAPPQPAKNTTGPSYGRFRFQAAKVVKWNCVFRVNDKAGIQPGEYCYRMFVIVGDAKRVKTSLQTLHLEFATPAR